MSNVSVDATESAHNENQPENNTRRRFLTVATSVVGGVGVVGAAVAPGGLWCGARGLALAAGGHGHHAARVASALPSSQDPEGETIEL